MSEVYELLGRSLDGNTLGQVGRQLGVDAGRAQSAIGMAVPVLLEALGRNASSATGHDALAAALDRDHDGSILDELGGFLAAGQADGVGGAILGHVLGGPLGGAGQPLAGHGSVEYSD
jgi:hypothetical protein